MSQYNLFKDQIRQASSKEERRQIEQSALQFRHDYQERIVLNKYDLHNRLKNFYNEINKHIEEYGLAGIKFRNKKQLFKVNELALDKIEQLNLNYVRTKNQYHQEFQKFTRRFKVQKIAVNKEYQRDAKKLRNQFHREKSKLTLRFELKNESLLLRGQLRKALSELKIQRRGVHSKTRLAIHLIRFDKNLTAEMKRVQLAKINDDYHQSRDQY